MRAYRTHLVVADPRHVTVHDVPFNPGEHVEVLFLAHEQSRHASLMELERLLKDTQDLPQACLLTDDDIYSEVAAFRNGR
jgi:hypothetical protein